MPLLDEQIALYDVTLLKSRAERYARRGDTRSEIALRAVSFVRGGGRFGCPLASLLAIRPLQQFCAIAGSSATVPGVVHYRGRLASVHDLGAFLSLDVAAIGEEQWLLIVDYEGHHAALLADDVIDVIELGREQLQAVPVGLSACEAIASGMSHDGVLLLDIGRALAHPPFACGF